MSLSLRALLTVGAVSNRLHRTETWTGHGGDEGMLSEHSPLSPEGPRSANDDHLLGLVPKAAGAKAFPHTQSG